MTLDSLRALARTRQLARLDVASPADLEADLRQSRPQGTTPPGAVWQILADHVSGEDLAVVNWAITRARGTFVWTIGGEEPRLQAIFKCLVVDPLPAITAEQRRTWSRNQFAAMAHYDRAHR